MMFPHTSVLTPNVHTRPLAVLGTSTSVQTAVVLCVDVGQPGAQSEEMVYETS